MNDQIVMQKTLITEAYRQLLEKNGYCNRDKIWSLFNFWLQDFFTGLKLNRKTPEKCLALMAYYSLYDNIYFTRKTVTYGNRVVKSLKKLRWHILAFLPIPRAVFSGGGIGKINSYLYNISLYKLKYKKPGLNNAMKYDFFLKIEKYLATPEMSKLRKTIPDEFFLNQWMPFNFPRKVLGSAVSLYDENCIKVLFIKKKLFFVGFQHGGNYGELIKNKNEDFEKELSDEFYHWGLGEKNIIQNRYEIEDVGDRVIKQALLVASVKPNVFLESYFPGVVDMYNEAQNNMGGLVDKLFMGKKVGRLKHPRYLDPAASSFETVLAQKDLSKEELQSLLLIFDKPGHTMLYQAIYQGIPFILYYNRQWARFFTDKFKHFLGELGKNKLLYYWDQEEDFLKHVKLLIREKYYKKENFSIARNFLEKGIS